MEIVFTAIIVALAFFGEAVFGFGGGLIAIPLLGVLVGVRDAVTLILLFQFFMGFLIFKTFKQTGWAVANAMTPGILVGTIVGAIFLSFVSDAFLLFFLSGFILLFLIRSLFFKGFILSKHKNRLIGGIAGLFGGLVQGIVGTGGPVLTMYLSVALPRKIAFRATLIYLFFITSIVRIGISWWQGLLTHELLKTAFFVLPFFLIAIFLGQHFHAKISEKYYRWSICTLLLISAVLMFTRALAS